MKLNVVVLLIALVAVIAFTMYYENITTLFVKAPYGSTSDKLYHKYGNLELETKSFGFPGTDNIYNYWKNMPMYWREFYSRKQTIKNVESTHDEAGELEPRGTNVRSLDAEYYNDPVLFMKRFPGKNGYPNVIVPPMKAVDPESTANDRTVEGLEYRGPFIPEMPGV
jgi:hypothetical protein